MSASLYDANRSAATTARLVEPRRRAAGARRAEATCAGAPEAVRAFSHEVWPDAGDGAGYLTVENAVAYYANVTIMDGAAGHALAHRPDRALGAGARGERGAGGDLRPVTSPWDHFDPQRLRLDVPNAFMTLDVSCDGGNSSLRDVVYWMHVSGVTVGAGVDAARRNRTILGVVAAAQPQRGRALQRGRRRGGRRRPRERAGRA